MNPRAIYEGSNGDATQALYDRLTTYGAIGLIALNLFRASKCSGRAKEYSRRYKADAYGRKNWSLGLLHAELLKYGGLLALTWGWKEDPKQEKHRQVLYVDLPTGQVSFHSDARLPGGLDYPGEWDRTHESPERIIRFTELVLETYSITHVGEAMQAAHNASLNAQSIFMMTVRGRCRPLPKPILMDCNATPGTQVSFLDRDLDSSCGE